MFQICRSRVVTSLANSLIERGNSYSIASEPSNHISFNVSSVCTAEQVVYWHLGPKQSITKSGKCTTLLVESYLHLQVIIMFPPVFLATSPCDMNVTEKTDGSTSPAGS